MAELLVVATDRTHTDPEKDARGCYKSGDIVVVFPDGHEWGKEERLPKFWQLVVPGLREELRQYAVPQVELRDPPRHIPDRTKIPTTVRRRRWSLDISLLPSRKRIDLLTIGRAELSIAEFQAAIEDKRSRT